jgi:pilin isopeptide linkage protein
MEAQDMDDMEKNTKRKNISPRKRRTPLGQRILATALVALTLFSTSSIQVRAEATADEDASAVVETVSDAGENDIVVLDTSENGETGDTDAQETNTATAVDVITSDEETVAEDVAETEEVTEADTEETPEEVTEETPEEVIQETPEETPEEVTEETPVEVTEETPEEVTEETPEEVTEEVAEEVTEEVAEDVTEEADETETATLAQTDYPSNYVHLEDYLTGGGTMYVTIDGKPYTLTQLEAKNMKVPQGASVEVVINFSDIEVAKDTVLYYQIPQEMITSISEDVNEPIVDLKTGQITSHYSISSSGLITLWVDSDFFDSHANGHTTITMSSGHVTFGGQLSKTHGVTPGNDDEKIILGSGDNKVEFTIPFEYPNENGKVEITKESTIDRATNTISYTITVTAPSTNTMTATKVVVQDDFIQGSQYLEKAYSVWVGYYTYRNTSISGVGGKFNTQTGTIELNDMAPGTSAVIKYTVQVSGDFFAAQSRNETIENVATATWYQSGSDFAESKQERGESLGLQKSEATIGEDEKTGQTYLEYTVTVTAPSDNKGVFPNVVVDDVMGIVNGSYTLASLDGIGLVDHFTTEASVGTVSTSGNNLTWTIGDMDKGAVATLKYRAYIANGIFGLKNDLVYTSDGSRGEVFNMTVRNSATVKSNGTQYGKVSNDTTLQKAWINKSGLSITDGEHADQLLFTLKVNSDATVRASGTDGTIPLKATVNTVTKLNDTLSGSGYTYDDTLVVKKYESAVSKKLLGTYEFDMSEVSTKDANDNYTSWALDLTNTRYGDISGPYYYEVTYYVKANGGSGSLSNGAGVGYLNGLSFSSGWSGMGIGTVKYTKEYVGGFNSESASWRATFTFNMPAGAVFDDYVPNDYEGNHYYFLTYKYGKDSSGTDVYKVFGGLDENGNKLSSVEVKVGDTVLSECPYLGEEEGCDHDYIVVSMKGLANYDTGEDYAGINGTTLDSDNKTLYQDSASSVKHCRGMSVKFLKNIEGVSASNPLIINYTMHVNHYSYNMDASKLSTFTLQNRSGLKLKESDTKYVATDDIDVPCYQDAALRKSTGILTSDGQILWTLSVNNGSTINGDAFILEQLPSGLTYDSIVVDYSQLGVQAKADVDAVVGANATEEEKNAAATAYFIDSITDYNGGGEVTDKTTIVKIQLKNLYQDPVATDRSKLTYGKVVLKLTTNLTEEAKLNSTNAKDSNGNDLGYAEYTNLAYIYAKRTYFSGKGTKYVIMDYRHNDLTFGKNYAQVSLLDKWGTYSGDTWPYIKYTIDVNASKVDLVDGADTVTIVDTMSEDCRLAKDAELAASFPQNTPTAFVVKDAKGNILTEGVDYTLEDETQSGDSHSFYLTVKDATSLTVTYYVAVNGVVGAKPTVSNNVHYEYSGSSGTSTPGSSYSAELSLASTKASTDYNYEFYAMKLDQNAQPLEDATFTLWSVELDSSGIPVLDSDGLPKLTKLASHTTGEDGKIWFEYEDLQKDQTQLFCVTETQAPDGYELSSTRYYVELTEHANAKAWIKANCASDTYTGITNRAGITVVDNLIKTSVTVPIQKDITLTTNNTAFTGSAVKFTFTLKPGANNPHNTYLDEKIKTELTADGTTVTIKGAGTDSLDLYFTKEGTYTYTVTENDLSSEVTAAGYGKDATEKTITVVVTADATGALTATMTQDSNQTLDADNPLTFTNTYTPEATLKGTKVISGSRGKAIQEGEFTFTVYESGKQVATGKTLAGGEIQFTPIQYTTEDAGTNHTYIVLEDGGTDGTITYSEEAFFAYAAVGSDLAVTVTYPKDIVFTNEYEASGSLKITGNKAVTRRASDVAANEFSFNVTKDGVYEATINTKAGGALALTLNYDQMDIGKTYVYKITENEGTDSTITYSDEVYTLTVTVADSANSDGTLAITATMTNKDGKTVDLDELNFINQGTYTPRSGIALDVLPYAVVAVLALGAGAVLIRRKRHTKA